MKHQKYTIQILWILIRDHQVWTWQLMYRRKTRAKLSETGTSNGGKRVLNKINSVRMYKKAILAGHVGRVKHIVLRYNQDVTKQTTTLDRDWLNLLWNPDRDGLLPRSYLSNDKCCPFVSICLPIIHHILFYIPRHLCWMVDLVFKIFERLIIQNTFLS